MMNFTVPSKYVDDYVAYKQEMKKGSSRRKYMNMVNMVEDEIMTEEDFAELFCVHSGERVGALVL